MSKIQTVRLINIGYNNNAMRISDECFHMNGESTLLSLRNGGGKSVLVQMMTGLSRAILPPTSRRLSWWNGRLTIRQALCSPG